ncbi:hypothetical protein EJ02DRAFT_156225 [Clathrospora elynae]|uniref:Uncharacterized protein n=1 Tax=Clathrospora elynae TaxID=706981 RepID=A0A6A5S954_9PLEO|nr:hypothetical protein EJ02DRAFT_156225 [Clathrospora elynae]
MSLHVSSLAYLSVHWGLTYLGDRTQEVTGHHRVPLSTVADTQEALRVTRPSTSVIWYCNCPVTMLSIKGDGRRPNVRG